MSFNRTSSNTTPDATSVSVKFVIVGGGLAGILTAYALKKAGHRVVVLEKRDSKSLSFEASCIRIPHNVAKLLRGWGLGPMLDKMGRKINGIETINGNTGEMTGILLLGQDFLLDSLTDLLLIQHKDLLNAFYDLAIRDGIEMRHNANVIHTDPDYVSVKLDTGEIISGDVIVAADGYNSSLLSNVTGSRNIKSIERALWASFTIEMCLLKDDESFSFIKDAANWTMWIGEGSFVHTHIPRGRKEKMLFGVLSFDYNGPSTEGDEEWSNSRGLESYGLDLTAFDLEPRVQKILRLCTIVGSRIYYKRPIPQDLVNDCSSIVLVGEAAHPVAILEGYQGAVLVIEDAVTLGSLFSRLRSRDQTKQLLTAYEEIRLPRCVRSYEVSEALINFVKCPKEKQHDRDDILDQTMTFVGERQNVMDKTVFLSVWAEQLSIFGYDAVESVDHWWRQWGSLISGDDDDNDNNNDNLQPKLISTGLQVWVSKE